MLLLMTHFYDLDISNHHYETFKLSYVIIGFINNTLVHYAVYLIEELKRCHSVPEICAICRICYGGGDMRYLSLNYTSSIFTDTRRINVIPSVLK